LLSGNGSSPAVMQSDTLVALASLLMQRSQAVGALGMQYGGDRDLYEALGYKKTLRFEDYWGAYERQDIATRIVDLPAIDSWRYPPRFSDGNDDDGTAFVMDFKVLASKLPVWKRLQQLDRVSGIGHYGCLLLGLRAGGELSAEVKPRSLRGPEDVIYLRVLSENMATIKEWEMDAASPRFGLPLMYEVSVGAGSREEQRLVHWTRIIHVAEDALDNDVLGTPRLRNVFNRLNDLEKIVGGGSEATWQVMDRGIHADMRNGFTMGPLDESGLSDEIDDYMHGRRRFLRTAGVDIKELGSETVDPSGLFGIILSLVAAARNVPQRILIGSERGELASSQDAETWAGVVLSRQTNFVEPVILRPFVDRLVELGALRPAQENRYKISWRSLLAHDDQKAANVAQGKALALASYAAQPDAERIVPPGEFRELWLDLPREVPKQYQASDTIKPREPVVLPADNGNNGGGNPEKLPAADNKLN